ncbi:hypothetical protein [Alkalicoccus halolimnae]|uniref:AMMECR1 domain-containing protein n=1 Tax=Alkalicoccus halolimnae TaxID=1667239 RepID=A0A5C7F826_9BACI|nr:hypothetical protein [Alkalicoccus halolimnae]TXF85528.1 hypothetical protein FTX54_08020 [Alkalicoccus halolimnae]
MKQAAEILFNDLLEKSEELRDLGLKNEDFDTLEGRYVAFIAAADNSGNRAYVTYGTSESVQGAVEKAYHDYLTNRPFKFKPKHIKLDIITKVTSENNLTGGVEKHIYKHNRGVNGIAFGPGIKAVFSPQEVECYKLIDEQKLSIEAAERALSQQLSAGQDWKQADVLFKFKTASVYVNSEETVELVRGHRVFDSLTKHSLLEAINLAKHNYFKKVVNEKGKMTYIYDPARNEKPAKYNILRHAGTIYSMLETYEIEADEEIIRKAELALNYIVEETKEVNENGEDALVLVERDVNKLGGNGLLLVALAKYMKLTGSRQYIDTMQKLAVWMTATQKENGDFGIHKQIFSTKEVTDFRSDFYTGEAILALANLYELDGNTKWLDSAEQATAYLVETANAGATLETVQSDHWLLYGIRAISRFRPRESFRQHAELMAESIMKSQFSGEKYDLEWQGGYPPQEGRNPKSVPNACKTEGLANVFYLTEDTEMKKRLADTIKRSIQFQLQMQIRPEKAMYFEKKGLSTGAFHNKFKVIELRNDFTQHNISSSIALYHIMNELE